MSLLAPRPLQSLFQLILPSINEWLCPTAGESSIDTRCKHEPEIFAMSSSSRVKRSATTEQLIPNDSLGVTADSPLILARNPAATFQNPIFSVSLASDAVHLRFTGQWNSFGEMASQRNNTDLNLGIPPEVVLGKLESSTGHIVSNIGVSVVIILEIDGERYAVLVHRQYDDRFMLLSGYVDGALMSDGAALRSLIQATAIKEVGEEIIAIGPSGLVKRGQVRGELADQLGSDRFVLQAFGDSDRGRGKLGAIVIPTAYESLSYEAEIGFSLHPCPWPDFLSNVHSARVVNVDGDAFECGFQYCQQWNSGQLILAFELRVEGFHELYLLHAEDRLDGRDKSSLVTLLDRKGITLCRLEPASHRLTEDIYRMEYGNLVIVNGGSPADRKFSEAFCRSPIRGISGFVAAEDILFKDIT